MQRNFGLSPIARANAKWESWAIEESSADPRLTELNICPVCIGNLPDCFCIQRREPAKSPYEAEVRNIDIRLFVTGCVIVGLAVLWAAVVLS